MKVLLIGNYAADQQYSMLGLAAALQSGLRSQGVEVRLLAPAVVLGKLLSSRPAHSGLRKWLGYVDKFIFFPRRLRKALAWADVVHICDHGNAVYTRYLQRVPHVVTCHDLLAIRSARGELPGWTTSFAGRIYQKAILNGLNQARRVVCVSETTRRDVLRISRVAQGRVSVIYDSLFYPYVPMPHAESTAVLKQLRLPMEMPFLLHVGSNDPYKNRSGVLKIFHALHQNALHHDDSHHDESTRTLRLVMVGRPFTPEMRQYVAEAQLDGVVIERTGVDNAQLRALYSRAKALVFPSLYEGFGLPIIEAQACGCPVFTSNRAPMTEVGGDAAVYFDPAQPEQAAQVIAEHLDSTSEIRDAGFENVKRFTLQRMLDGYLKVYQELLEHRQTRNR